MADETTPTPAPETPATTTDSTPTPAAPPVAPAVALWLEVASAATTKGSAVRELVISELTQQEIIKRKDAVIVLLGKYEDKTKELKKQEKTLATVEYDAEGKESRKYYTAEASKTLKGLRDEIANLSEALNKFFENNDTKKLYELAKK